MASNPWMSLNTWPICVWSTPTTQWRLGAGVRYVGERYADNANTVREPSYTLLDAFVSFNPCSC